MVTAVLGEVGSYANKRGGTNDGNADVLWSLAAPDAAAFAVAPAHADAAPRGVQEHALSLRLALVQEIHGERYEPRATCPNCGRKMTPAEIIRGFNAEPTDYTTRCTGCGHRFAPSLVCFGNGSELVLPFYCDNQTLAQMHGKETLAPEEFARQHPAIYRSAVVHHGGMRSAFAKIGIVYSFEEVSDWTTKVAAFLGRMPDTIIAECVHRSPRAIRRLRREFGVGKYSLRAALAEAGVEV